MKTVYCGEFSMQQEIAFRACQQMITMLPTLKFYWEKRRCQQKFWSWSKTTLNRIVSLLRHRILPHQPTSPQLHLHLLTTRPQRHLRRQRRAYHRKSRLCCQHMHRPRADRRKILLLCHRVGPQRRQRASHRLNLLRFQHIHRLHCRL